MSRTTLIGAKTTATTLKEQQAQPLHKKIEHSKRMINNMNENFAEAIKMVEQTNATNPNHYNQMKIQPNEYITANQNCFSWNTANVIKYVSRYKSKNGIEDLEKAIKYLQFEIEELKKAEQC